MSTVRKKESLFHFKKFSVRHDRSGMRVGTDGVLLGAWADVTGVKRILDIGSGTGVIALMLAQRSEGHTKIEAVEIDEHAHADAVENFNASPWKEKLIAHHTTIQNFNSLFQFDLIVSNPPYFQNSFKPPDQKRQTARHTETLSFTDLLNVSSKFLSPTGRLSVILPFTEGQQFITLAEQQGYTCSRKWNFRSRERKPIERLLLEFTQTKKETDEGEIILHAEGEELSTDYKNITKDFYLKL
jgi:tRNA1Val (adenine37-N6)-methyltransferase